MDIQQLIQEELDSEWKSLHEQITSNRFINGEEPLAEMFCSIALILDRADVDLDNNFEERLKNLEYYQSQNRDVHMNNIQNMGKHILEHKKFAKTPELVKLCQELLLEIYRYQPV
jgi:hypothetical protein